MLGTGLPDLTGRSMSKTRCKDPGRHLSANAPRDSTCTSPRLKSHHHITRGHLVTYCSPTPSSCPKQYWDATRGTLRPAWWFKNTDTYKRTQQPRPTALRLTRRPPAASASTSASPPGPPPGQRAPRRSFRRCFQPPAASPRPAPSRAAAGPP